MHLGTIFHYDVYAPLCDFELTPRSGNPGMVFLGPILTVNFPSNDNYHFPLSIYLLHLVRGSYSRGGQYHGSKA